MHAGEIRDYAEKCASDAATNDGLIVARAILELAAQVAELKEIIKTGVCVYTGNDPVDVRDISK